MLTEQDLNMIRDRAIRSFVKMPTRCRLPGMREDISTDEIRTLAFYEAASVTIFQKLREMGCEVTPEMLNAVSTGLFTVDMQPIEGVDVSYNAE